MLRSSGQPPARRCATCLRRMGAMPISGLTWVMERARKVANDAQEHDSSKSGEENVRSNAIVIASAARTAVGSFNGAFAATPAHELGAVVIKELLARAGVEAAEVDEVILGQVLTAGQGQNPARQASINAGLPKETTAWGLNQVCGSGLRAVALGMQQIATGDAKIDRRRRPGIDVAVAARRSICAPA